LIELTQDARLQWIPDDWRKAAQFVSFLATTLRVGGRDVAQILVRRDVIGQLLDIFLGDVSPLKGRVYFTGSSSAANGSSAGASSGASTTTSAATSISITRKRAPSSYVTAPLTKDFPKVLPTSLRSIPDWTMLLECVVRLVSECLLTSEARDYYQNKRRRTAIPLSSPYHDLLMSEYDYECLTCKTLYTTLIKQARYRSHLCGLIRLLTPNNYVFSNMMLEVLWEECTAATPEACLVLFEATEALLSVQDQNHRGRIYSLLGRGSQSLLELAATMINQSHKAHFLLTFIRSFVALLSRLPEICHVVATPIDNVPQWAKWMLRHCHSLRTPATTTTSAGATATTTTTTTTTTGPFLVVYGETEEEREIAWSVRAERTYELLALRLFEWGLEPDTWIATPVPAVVSTTTSSTALVTTDVPIAGPVMRVTADGLVPVSTTTGGTHTGSSSLTHANRSSVQNTSTNSLRSTDAVDGDVPTDMNYHEIFTDDMVNDNLSVGGHGSVGHVPSTASTVTQVGHDMGVGTQTSQMAVDDDDIPIFVDGMTDEEFELALARGGMFQ
jgi:hypothetical protein